MQSLFELKCVSDVFLPDVYYIVIESSGKEYARLRKESDYWQVWYYTEKYGILRKSLELAFLSIERQYIRSKIEIPAEHTKKSN